MSNDTCSSPLTESLEKLMYVILVGASTINLGANFIGDVASALSKEKWVHLLLVFSKPLIVPSLASVLFLSTRGTASSIRRGSFYAALFFCWVGDIALLSERTFFIGLGSFGVAHLFFIRSYLLLDKRVLQWKSFAYGLPFIVYGYTLYSIIHDHFTNEKKALVEPLAIAIYMVVLLSNGLIGFLRLRLKNMPHQTPHLSSSASILVGIVLFVQSDSIIAVARYVGSLPLEQFSIMATYILALYLMVRGCIIDSQESASEWQRETKLRPIPLAAAA